jgi:GT2 family glycosyltransferase
MEGSLSSQLSVVVVSHCDSENFRMALRNLRAQTVSNLLEVIIVTSSQKDLNLDPRKFEGFSNHKILEVRPFGSGGAAKAAGVIAAGAPLVAFAEDHSYPERGWAEALIGAHRKGNFAVVGPVMLNANPHSGLSWGCFLAYYGHWLVARLPEEVKHLPANQSCYKRDLLLQYGSRLSEMLEAESVLHWDFLSKGHQLYQEPTAKVYHLNHSLLSPMLREYYLTSRVFAAKRGGRWRLPTRVAYALGSPLLPLLRLRRIVNDASQAGLQGKVFFRSLAALVLVLCAGSAGEACGYAFGVGKASERLARFESKRHLSFTARDLDAVARL